MADHRKYYRDFREHLKALEQRGKLVRIQRQINKDTELMPLVRWQFRGLEERERKAFLFENIVDSKGRRYTMPVTVGTLAATTEIYAIGMMCEPDEIAERWTQAQLNPIEPVKVDSAPAQEVVWQGAELLDGHGLDMIPVPISTPGFDNAPYLTSANWITKDVETEIYNIGNYRSQIKAANRTGGLFTTQHMGQHWRKCKAKGQRLEACIAIGVIPSIAYSATAKIPYDFDEYRLAGGLAGAPVEVVQAKTVDLLVPATAEIIIEGTIPTDMVEPEGPFGEYPGYMGHRTVSPVSRSNLHYAPAGRDLHRAHEPIPAQRVEQDQTHWHGKNYLQVFASRQRQFGGARCCAARRSERQRPGILRHQNAQRQQGRCLARTKLIGGLHRQLRQGLYCRR